MSAQKSASWAYAEEFIPESAVADRARARGQQLGCAPMASGAAAVLRLLAAALQARTVVEVGTGAGVSGLWLLEGMAPDGILTSIDVEPAHQRAAREAFTDAGIPHQRFRLITGRALDVLPRLTDEAYDMVVVDADKESYPAYVEQAMRLLRPGGVLVLDEMLWHDQVADPAARDDTTGLLRDLGKQVRERDDLTPVLLAAGGGVLAAVKR
ncbi:O-methyltransferase [Arsenicicoccus dermatophilus]|uniref:O-methyltransferase n=1 Tax=Arsenicicoccus dermatophilus TaxID=1076331 RepID=UPI00391709C1